MPWLLCLLMLPNLILLVVIGADPIAVSQPPPELHVRARSYTDAGFQVGQAFSDRIHSFWQDYRQTSDVQAVFKYITDTNGKASFQALANAIQQHMPNQWDELKGLAQGSGLSFRTILIINLLPELVDLVDQSRHHNNDNHGTTISRSDDDNSPINQACTDLLLHDVGLAHNEDNEPAIGRYAYILHVSIIDNDDVNNGDHYQTKQDNIKQHPWFTAYTYPGTLPGCAWAFNSHGLVQTTNALFPEDIGTTNIGRYIVARSLLTASSIDQVHTQMLLHTQEASAFSVNFVELSTGNLTNFEVASGHPVNRYDVDHYYNHVNSFKRIHPIRSRPNQSSEHRQATLDSLGTPQSMGDMRSILGDTSDPAFPIYRNATGPDRCDTLCTLIVDLQQKQIQLFMKNPASSSFQRQWNFPQLSQEKESQAQRYSEE